jgi:hypothetical protein
MRLFIAVAATAIACCAFDGASNSAKADPYRWCAQYGARGATNCYFVTLAQCRAALAGNGGFCNVNTFYDGRPVVTPEDGVRRMARRVR